MGTRGPAPGFHRHPAHRIEIRDSARHWQVKLGASVIADSQAVRILEETGYGAVSYFPAQDICLDALAKSQSQTTCPFKGRADYFKPSSAADSADIAWTYPATYDEARAIEGYVAFYADRVSIEHSVRKSSLKQTKGNLNG